MSYFIITVVGLIAIIIVVVKIANDACAERFNLVDPDYSMTYSLLYCGDEGEFCERIYNSETL